MSVTRRMSGNKAGMQTGRTEAK